MSEMKPAVNALLADLDLYQYTDREAIELDETDKWSRLSSNAIFDRHCIALRDGTEQEREAITREEVLAWNKLMMRGDLIRHGYTPSPADEEDLLRVIRVEPPQLPNEDWKNLPQILPTVEREELQSMGAMCRALGIADPKASRSLQQAEEAARQAIVGAQAQIHQRTERTFSMYLQGLKDLEANLVGEVMHAFLLRLQPDERVAYLMRPVIGREALFRQLIAVEEQALRGHATLPLEEASVRSRLLRFIADTLKDRRERKLAAALLKVSAKATFKLRSWRYFTWKTHVAEKARVNKAIKLMLSISLTQNITLMTKYCGIWNMPLHKRRCITDQRALAREAAAAFEMLVVREEEERARNFTLISWENSRSSMTDAFLAHRDQLRLQLLRGRAVALREISHLTHLRTRMLTLYRYVVRKTQLQRAQWLGESNTLITLQRYFLKFRHFPTVARRNLNERRAANHSFSQLHEAFGVIMLENYDRVFLAAEVDAWLGRMWRSHGTVVEEYCQQLQAQAVDALRVRCARHHTKMRFEAWLWLVVDRSPEAAASAMWHRRNKKVHALSGFQRWRRWLDSRKAALARAVRASAATRAVEALQESEARHRLDVIFLEGRIGCILQRRGQTKSKRAIEEIKARAEGLALTSCRRTRLSAFVPWLAWTLKKLRRRQQRIAISAMSCAAAQRTRQRHFSVWIRAAARLQLLQRITAALAECAASEVPRRKELLDLERREREVCAASLAQDARLADFQRMRTQSCALVARSSCRHLHRRFATWLKRIQRVMHKRGVEPEMAARGRTANLRYYFAKIATMRRWTQGSRLAQGLLSRVEKHLALKYFRRLYPAAVRQAKVCRARNALAQAQAAARLLDGAAASSTGPTVAGRSLPKSFLPPLLRHRTPYT